MNPFIQVNTPPTTEQLKQYKLQREHAALISAGTLLLNQSIQTVKNQWESVWENQIFTPAEKLAQMGTDAVSIFDTAAKFTAAIYSIDPSLLDIKYLSAALPYTAHEDGTITLV